jgi:hypothetical protein
MWTGFTGAHWSREVDLGDTSTLSTHNTFMRSTLWAIFFWKFDFRNNVGSIYGMFCISYLVKYPHRTGCSEQVHDYIEAMSSTSRLLFPFSCCAAI